MTRPAATLAALLLLGCGSLPTVSGDIAILEITPPASLTIDVGAHLAFHARALDKKGNTIEAQITWRTPDATITVDAASGVVTGVKAGTGRVQAAVGGTSADDQLVSDFVIVTVRAPPAPGGIR